MVPAGVSLGVYKAAVDDDTGEYSNYPLGSFTPYPKIVVLPGGDSTGSMTERTVTVSGADLVRAFGANETDAHLALVFDDDDGTCPYDGGKEVFRLTALRVRGTAQDWTTVETRSLANDVRTASLAGLSEGRHRFRLTAESADGTVTEAAVEKEVSSTGSAPVVSVVAQDAQSVTFAVEGAADFTYGFEKQSNALNGTPTKTGNTVCWRFANPIDAVGTHWLALSVTNAVTGVGTTCVHITNPPADHPLGADYEGGFDAAVARARREGKLVFLLATGDPDSTKFRHVAGMLSSNEVVSAVSGRYVYTEALTSTAGGDALAQRYWRAQPTIPGDATPASYLPLIMGYAMVVDPNRPEVPYPCDVRASV